jgi:hypothetical protein
MIELAAEVRKLQDTIETFMKITDVSLSPHLPRILAIFPRNVKVIRDFFELLDHEEALKWMAWHYRHDIIGPFVPIRGYLDILQFGMLKLDISWTSEQELCLNQAIEQAATLHDTLSEFLQNDLNPYRSEPKSFMTTARPEVAVAPIWSIAKYLLRDISPRFAITFQPDLPLMCYDMLYTTSLLENFFRVISREQSQSGVVTVVLKREEVFCALSIHVQDLRMTPQLWEQTQQSFYYGDEIERLHELGGSIEPLTWDEGQGQGVILRLPWAKI